MIEEPFARTALWSKRLGLFAVPVAVIAVFAQRSGRVGHQPAMAALGSGMAVAALAIALGLAALAIIWVRGNRGAGAAALGILAGVLVIAPPLYVVAQGASLPPLIDIATDPAHPPAFVFAGAERGPGDNPVDHPGEAAALAQMSAYSDIQPLRVAQPPDEAHALALQLVEAKGWRVLDSGYTARRIEAVATTPVMKFADDVVIEITPDGNGSRIDMRSAARSGARDFGRNAERVRGFLAELAAQAR